MSKEPNEAFIAEIICPHCGQKTLANIPSTPPEVNSDTWHSSNWLASYSRCSQCGTKIHVNRHCSGVWKVPDQ